MSDNFNNDDLNKNEEQPWERKFGEDENLKTNQDVYNYYTFHTNLSVSLRKTELDILLYTSSLSQILQSALLALIYALAVFL